MPILFLRGHWGDERLKQPCSVHPILSSCSTKTTLTTGSNRWAIEHPIFTQLYQTNGTFLPSFYAHSSTFLHQDHYLRRGRESKCPSWWLEVRKIGKNQCLRFRVCSVPRKVRQWSQIKLQASISWGLHQALVQKCEHLSLLQGNSLNKWFYIPTFSCKSQLV